MNDVFFTADQHFGHTSVIKYMDRPFSSTDEMHEIMIENHNKTVKPGDRIYHIGDFAWGDHNKYLSRLKGNNYLIKGNHDHLRRLKEPLLFREVYDVKLLKVNGMLIWLSHYAHRVWPQSPYGSFHLYGHSHGMMEGFGRSMDVGVDSFNFTPVSLEDVASRLNKIDLFMDHHPKGDLNA